MNVRFWPKAVIKLILVKRSANDPNRAVDQGQEPDYANPSGPIYVVTGGGGGGLLGLDSSSFNVRAVAAHHIVEISLSDGEMIGRAIRPSGLVIDEFRVGQ